MAQKSRESSRVRRHARVREKVKGSSARPRLAVYRSITHIYAQLIDDVEGKTLAAASSLDARESKDKKAERAKAVGTALGERAKKAGINEVVFDRGGYRYHGRVKALAEGVRAAGVKV
ncbi:MAG TPA: 50S ribosomal protein L18 [Candidatus Limnocylindrales bacterium]|nr:50S ribosomal protein L18 [Candidatus Limnocylindrales bacterium]